MQLHSRRLGIKGDTIVEVLIATVVASSVLVGAFTIANKSSQQIRSAQEQSEALKLTTAAIESIDANATTAVKITPDVAFCPDLLSFAIPNTGTPPTGQALPATKADNTVGHKYNVACLQTPSSGVQFATSVTRVGSTSTFEIHTRWDLINGKGRGDITMSYRADK